MERSCGVDAAGIAADDVGTVHELSDADGRIWYCRQMGGGHWTAFRELTDEEIMETIEAAEDMTHMMLRKPTVSALREVSLTLKILADAMRPDHPFSRHDRRALKRRLFELGNLSQHLLHFKLSGQQVRERCRALGVAAQGLDYQQWLNEQY